MPGYRRTFPPSRTRATRFPGLLALVLLTLTLGSCAFGPGEHAAPDWRYPDVDSQDSLRYPVAWREEWSLERMAVLDHLPARSPQVPNPSEPSGPADPGTAAAPPGTPSARRSYRGFFGDVRGNSRPELILATPKAFVVYDLDGALLGSYSIPLETAVPAFLMDFDGDRKLDLLLGSVGEVQPTFLVMNGMGRLIYRYRISDSSRDYGSLIPVLPEGDAIYLLAEEHWVDSPRGFIRYSVSKHEEEWTFRVPGNPLDLRPAEKPARNGAAAEPVFVVSYATRSTGMARYIGTEPARELQGLDALTRLIQFGASGRSDAAALVLDRNLPMSGNAQLYPLPAGAPGDYLLRLDRLGQDAAVPGERASLRFFSVEKGPGGSRPARVLSRLATRVDEVLDFRIVPTETSVSFLFLVREGERYFLERRDGAFELQTRRLVHPEAAPRGSEGPASDGVAVHLGPVLQAREEGAGASLLLLTPGKLLLADGDLRLRTLAEVSGGRQVLVNLSQTGGRLLVLGRETVMYRVQ